MGVSVTPFTNAGASESSVLPLLIRASSPVVAPVALLSNGGGSYGCEGTPTAAGKNQMLFFQAVALRQDNRGAYHYLPAGNVVCVFLN